MAIIADICGAAPGELSPNLALFKDGLPSDSLDLDSLEALQLSVAISEEFGVGPDAVADPRVRTIGDLVTLVRKGSRGP